MNKILIPLIRIRDHLLKSHLCNYFESIEAKPPMCVINKIFYRSFCKRFRMRYRTNFNSICLFEYLKILGLKSTQKHLENKKCFGERRWRRRKKTRERAKKCNNKINELNSWSFHSAHFNISNMFNVQRSDFV